MNLIINEGVSTNKTITYYEHKKYAVTHTRDVKNTLKLRNHSENGKNSQMEINFNCDS